MAKIKKSKYAAKKTSSSKTDQSFTKKEKRKSQVVKISTPISRINRKIISKKEKQKIKKQKVLEGIKNTKKKFAEEKARLKREKTAIVGDLRPLLDSLPSLDELMTIRDSKRQSMPAGGSDRRNATRKPKNKYERRRMLINEKTEKFYDRFDHINKLWKDPQFQKNPRQLIAERIKNRNENEMQS